MKMRITILLETEFSLVRTGLEMQQAILSCGAFKDPEVISVEEIKVTYEDLPNHTGIVRHMTPVRTAIAGSQNIVKNQEHCPMCGK